MTSLAATAAPPTSPTRERGTDPARDSLLAGVVDEYLAACRAGERPDIDALIARHPEIAADLAACLASLDFLENIAQQERLLAPPAAGENGNANGNGAAPRRVEGTLGDYRILGEIGRGGMGVVYEAQQISLQRRVALKVLPFGAILDERAKKRFQNEALAAAQLDHPHIVDVYGVGCERGVHYYAMRLIEGRSLAEIIQHLREQLQSNPRYTPSSLADLVSSAQAAAATQQITGDTLSSPAPTTRPKLGPPYYRAIATLGMHVAEALDHAHEQGVLHRDIKPSNLMLDSAGKVWITDFGLARLDSAASLTHTGDLLGTLRYMSPEQALAKRVPIDHRSDIYSLGVTLYELVTLQPAFDSENRGELLRQVAFEEPIRPRQIDPQIPHDLETIVLKTIEKNPAERYQTAEDLAADLHRFVREEPIRARPISKYAKLWRWWWRRPIAAALLAVLIVVAIVSPLVAFRQAVLASSESQARHDAEQEGLKKREALATVEKTNDALRSQRADLRQNLYRADTDIAYRAWNEGHVERAIELLKRHLPVAGDNDLRGFEWHHWWQRCHDYEWRVEVPEKSLTNVAFSHDHRYLAACVWDPKLSAGEVRVYEAASGIRFRTVPISQSPNVIRAVFSWDDRWLVLWEARAIILIDVASGKTESIPLAAGGHCAIAASPRTSVIAVGDDQSVSLLSLDSRETVRTWKLANVNALQFSPDGKLLAAGSHREVSLINVESDEVLKVGGLSPYDPINRNLSFSSAGDSLARSGAQSMAFSRIDSKSGNSQSVVLNDQQKSLKSLMYVPGTNLIATLSGAGIHQLWDAEGKLVAKTSRLGEPTMAYSSDGKLIAFGLTVYSSEPHYYRRIPAHAANKRGSSGAFLASAARASMHISTHDQEPLKVWRASCSKEHGVLNMPVRRTLRGRQPTAVSQDGTMIATLAGEKGITVLQGTDFSEQLTLEEQENDFCCIDISPDKSLIATGSLTSRTRNTLAIRDAKTLQEVRQLEGHVLRKYDGSVMPGHYCQIVNVDFSPNGKFLASVGNDCRIRVWDVATGAILRELTTREDVHSDGSQVMAWSSDGEYLAAGVNGKMAIKLWKVKSGELAATFVGHTSTIYGLAFAPDGRTLASSSSDKTVRLWSLPTREPIAVLADAPVTINSLAFSTDGRTLIGGDSEGFLNYWRTEK